MLPVPNLVIPFLDERETITSPWASFFQQFTQAPPGAISLILTASPFHYIVREPGLISVHGGTVSNITFKRGIVTIDVTGQKLIPVSVNDTIITTYSVLPIIQFLPNFGNVSGR